MKTNEDHSLDFMIHILTGEIIVFYLESGHPARCFELSGQQCAALFNLIDDFSRKLTDFMMPGFEIRFLMNNSLGYPCIHATLKDSECRDYESLKATINSYTEDFKKMGFALNTDIEARAHMWTLSESRI